MSRSTYKRIRRSASKRRDPLDVGNSTALSGILSQALSERRLTLRSTANHLGMFAVHISRLTRGRSGIGAENSGRVHEVLKENGVPTEYHMLKDIAHYDVYSGQCLDDLMKLEISWFDKYLKK